MHTSTTGRVSDVLKVNYYHSLNGLRGISIILVVFFHSHLIATPLFNGPLGVNIFFVLSGFLITTICLKEISNTGTFSLKKFYARRVLRIFPVAYLYISIILLLNILMSLHIQWYQFAAAMLYIMDFSYFRSHGFTWILAHYWSLSVEEQFYLIFPSLLLLNKRLFTAAIVFIVFALPILCLLQFIYPYFNNGVLYMFTHFFIKFQGIAVGCMFALLAFEKAFDYPLLNQTKLVGNILAFFLIFYLGFNDFYTIKSVFINLLISIITGYIIVSNLLPSDDIIFKALNFKPLVYIGVISYSIYIWQQLFTDPGNALPKYLTTTPYNLVFILVVSLASYFGYERYFLRLKSKLKAS